MTLTFDSTVGGFNDSELRDFIKDKELISANDYLFVRNEVPYLTVVLRYLPSRVETDARMAPQGKRQEDWREQLSEPDMGLFNLLRDWRSTRCKKEGLPPYILFTNKQLAQIVKTRPQSLAELSKIDGVGQSKAEKYGTEVLEISKINLGEPTKAAPEPSGTA
jgi:superfamily II DNA helicase RecQ